MKLSVCGAVCTECPYHHKQCDGCHELSGRPFWVEDIDDKICILYRCSREKGHLSCGDCAELPCRSFRELKDPDISDEEHLAGVDRRIERLRGRT